MRTRYTAEKAKSFSSFQQTSFRFLEIDFDSSLSLVGKIFLLVSELELEKPLLIKSIPCLYLSCGVSSVAPVTVFLFLVKARV